MGNMGKNRQVVPRRIGGLEIMVYKPKKPAKVPRRIGGLENGKNRGRAASRVPRRIGGLEIPRLF